MDDREPTLKKITGAKMQDITAPEIVEIEIRRDGKIVWINVDGVAALRACRVENLTVIDHRTDDDA